MKMIAKRNGLPRGLDHCHGYEYFKNHTYECSYNNIGFYVTFSIGRLICEREDFITEEELHSIDFNNKVFRIIEE